MFTMLFKMHAFWTIFLLIIASVECELCDRGTGECKELTDTDCPVIFYNQHLIGDNVKYCDEFNDIVCCPLSLNAQNKVHVVENRPYEKRKFLQLLKVHYDIPIPYRM